MKILEKIKESRKAFTLIELLIVVAIIAILAAIAVPNFLEAQVRAKVSRAQADMRTIKTGLEVYRVDNNAYPIDYNGTPGNPGDDEFTTWTQLTTPVSYLTSVLFTPFQSGEAQYQNNPYGSQNVYEYWAQPFWQQNTAVNNVVNRYGFQYIVGTLGPNLRRDNLLVTPVEYDRLARGAAIVYDPTNGTLSDGDILMSNLEFH